MKKIKFLSGVGAAFAFAAVALTTTFTSCEKESLSVTVEQSPAKVSFVVTVIDAATNIDVTSNATITGAEDIVSTASDKSLAGGQVTVSATVNGVSGSTTVSYSALTAGQVTTLSVTVLLDSQFDYAISGEATALNQYAYEWGNAAAGHDHNGNLWAENASDYLTPFTATWNKSATATKKTADIYVASSNLNILEEMPVTNEGSANFEASAWCLYNAYYTIQAAEIVYTYTSIASGEVVAKVTYVNPIWKITAEKKEVAFPGHESAYEHGHGHGNNPNAGGGIGLAD